MAPQIVSISSLDWPESPSDLPTATVQRAGQSFLGYEARARGWLKRPTATTSTSAAAGPSASSSSTLAKKPKEKPAVDLFSFSEEELSDLSYYEVLGNVPIHSTPDQLKKYYRKACLKYHPDKTGRGEEDAVFLAVKAAFETLSDPAKKKSYDSTLDFDDSIPAGNEDEGEFFAAYGPVFERNLRFDRRYDPAAAASASKGGGKGGKKKNKKKGGKGGSAADGDSPPTLGDDTTPIDQVHAFYDYWTHFDSWRDFTLKASESTDHDIDMADSRDEQRWMKKEIDRKAKALKREEIARIALLVERAMNADPRLKREREREKEEKKRMAEEKERKRAEKERKEAEEKARKEKEEAGECIILFIVVYIRSDMPPPPSPHTSESYRYSLNIHIFYPRLAQIALKRKSKKRQPQKSKRIRRRSNCERPSSFFGNWPLRRMVRPAVPKKRFGRISRRCMMT